MSFILSNSGDFVTFTPANPYTRVISVDDWTENLSGTGTLTKEFRWSINNESFSSWISLTTEEVQKVVVGESQKVYAEFKYTLDSGGPIEILETALTVSVVSTPEIVATGPIRVTKYGAATGPVFLTNTRWNPYQNEAGVRTYKALSKAVSALFGHNVKYYRVAPDKKIGTDHRLQEYTIYNVIDTECLKIIIPQNQFPDFKLDYSQFGIDFEFPLEAQIVKESWEEIFGIGTGPQKKDIVWFEATNRLYQVESSYLNQEFMLDKTYWKVSLTKYKPSTTINMPSEIADELDSMTLSMEKVVGEILEEEEKQTANSLQFNVSTTTTDPNRIYIHKDLAFNTKRADEIENYFTVISQSQYDLNSIFNIDTYPLEAIRYKPKVEFSATDDRAFTAWFKETTFSNPTRPVVSVVAASNVLTVTLQNRLLNGVVGNYVSFASPAIVGFPVIGKITAIDSTELILTVECHPDVIAATDTRLSNWKALTNLVASKTPVRTFLNGHNGTTGIKIESFGSWIFKVSMNDDEYVFLSTTALLTDKWYGIVLNMSNVFEQLDLTIWRRMWESSESNVTSTALQKVFSKSLTGIDAETRTIDDHYTISASPMCITNIRLVSKVIEIEQQQMFLNRMLVSDPKHSIIVDNAIVPLNVPYVGKNR